MTVYKIVVSLIIIALTSGCMRNTPAPRNVPNSKTRDSLPNIIEDTRFAKPPGSSSFVFSRTGADSLWYELNISDTLPGYPYSIPHLIALVGPPTGLHSLMTLENTQVLNDEKYVAAFGVEDSIGRVGYVLKATPKYLFLLASDYFGYSTQYYFTTRGLNFRSNKARWFTISSQGGLPGQILQLDKNADTAFWSYPIIRDTIFVANEAQTIYPLLGWYNIVEPKTKLTKLTISLPPFPKDGDIVELKFVQPIQHLQFANGRVNSAYENYGMLNNYSKLVYNGRNASWY